MREASSGLLFAIDLNHFSSYKRFTLHPEAIADYFGGFSQKESGCFVIQTLVRRFESISVRWTPLWLLKEKVGAQEAGLVLKAQSPPAGLAALADDSPPSTPWTMHSAFLVKAISDPYHSAVPFWLIESADAYEEHIRPYYMSSRLPVFLANLIRGDLIPYRTDSHPALATIRGPGNNYCVIPARFGCWLLTPNPKYHISDLPLSFDERFCWVAWWISPSFVSAAELSARITELEQAPAYLSPRDLSRGMDESDVQKRIPAECMDQEVYLCTIRDVRSDNAKASLCDLYRGAKTFFRDRYQVDIDSLEQVDCHYPPGRLYGTLHFHFRRESTMSGQELIMRHRLTDMVTRVPSSDGSKDGQDVLVNQVFFESQVYFEYPHHSHRVFVADLVQSGRIPSFQPTSGAKSYEPSLPVIVIGAESNQKEI